ncbi:surface antigen-domain-containing protein [Phakopsora pachyrhizi]|nr:surface antigen-domain-containing protein [Phakopsora pachyrhizi]
MDISSETSFDQHHRSIRPDQIIFEESDVDRQLEWHQNRLNSRRRKDEVRLLKNLTELSRYDSFDLSSIRVIGSKSTRPELLKRIFEDSGLLSASDCQHGQRRLSEILRSTDGLYRTLSGLGIFSHLQISLDSPPRSSSQRLRGQSSSDTTQIEAIIRLVERSRFFLKTSTDIGNGEGALTGLARMTNLYGNGEILEASLGLGSRTTSNFQLRTQVPILAARASFELAGYACERDLTGFASCDESLRGISTKLKTDSSYGSHEFSYDIASRSLGNLKPSASISLKSSISNLWIRDTRDHSSFPTSGSCLKFYQEYAGLGGDSNFFKSTVESTFTRQLFNPHNILTIGFQTGLITPLFQNDHEDDNNQRKIRFSDKFQLGGPTSVRMFKMNSLGSKDGNDHLGGNFYWATGLSVLSDIPRKSDWPLKLHTFINAGRLSNHCKMIFEGGPSVSCGIGVAGKIQDVRLEVNLGLPLCLSEGDGARRGLQVGLGISFLS